MPCTKGLERMGCSMIWDGMPCTKGLERMGCPMVWDGMPEWDWMPDGMGRNALCEGTCCPMVWDEMPYAKELIARVKGLDALCEGT